ncbi:unnamed protein product [Protopolystoma xenopodis]|uniref:Uncharacterized protein n=1 Tax=Protopolystoma xenopodis TaxID=117903 RepID=A0A3S5AXV7_9PLAT|nr:unnamed protein product [Protopolystoma xenopodis]
MINPHTLIEKEFQAAEQHASCGRLCASLSQNLNSHSFKLPISILEIETKRGPHRSDRPPYYIPMRFPTSTGVLPPNIWMEKKLVDCGREEFGYIPNVRIYFNGRM